ncbi:helix-turn-helix domain-containing protein [Halomonas fontilapidosi]|uniref:helix-turn-helix domain-containing protein n=1 Tax=Halomonas fontilapidosi TaxID=616675 RepID=UPI0031B615B7
MSPVIGSTSGERQRRSCRHWAAPTAPSSARRESGYRDIRIGNPRRGDDPLQEALRRHRWNISAVARDLGLSRPTIYRRMKRLGIVPPHHQEAHGSPSHPTMTSGAPGVGG